MNLVNLFIKSGLEIDIYDYRLLKSKNSPWLIFSSSKKNQNFYRDKCLAEMTGGIFLTETFDFGKFNYNIQAISEYFFSGGIGGIFINYVTTYTNKLDFSGLKARNLCGFVGDHYNFTEKKDIFLDKQNFFKKVSWDFIVSAYPHTNHLVEKALGRKFKFIDLPWAIDPLVFRDLKDKRKFDIVCMGALSERKYTFRKQMREWMIHESGLKYYKKSRAKGANGADHDGITFNKALNASRAAFSCASSKNYTLMKYFEIPASGTLLFAEKTELYEAMGFVDGIHYVAVTPEDYREKITLYLSNNYNDVVEKIVENGTDFIMKNHTWDLRIKVFLKNFNYL
jgi:hypothetical protein